MENLRGEVNNKAMGRGKDAGVIKKSLKRSLASPSLKKSLWSLKIIVCEYNAGIEPDTRFNMDQT